MSKSKAVTTFPAPKFEAFQDDIIKLSEVVQNAICTVDQHELIWAASKIYLVVGGHSAIEYPVTDANTQHPIPGPRHLLVRYENQGTIDVWYYVIYRGVEHRGSSENLTVSVVS